MAVTVGALGNRESAVVPDRDNDYVAVDEKRTKVISFRLTQKDTVALKRIAHEDGRTASAYVWRLVTAHLREKAT
jgi:hypothetical protein